MLISIIPIGNSKGIRIPKNILQQLNIEEQVEIEVRDTELLIRPARKKPRDGWREAFRQLHAHGDDTMLIQELSDEEDFTWDW